MYRRNSDDKLRNLEREFYQSNDPSILIEINHIRQRVNLPPHPASRIRVARSFLSQNMCRGVASQIVEFVDTYLDPALYISQLPEGSELQQNAIAVMDDYNRFREEWRIVSGEIVGATNGLPEEEDFVDLLHRYGLYASPLGPEIDIPEGPEGTVSIIPNAAYREGFGPRIDNINIVSRLVCQQSIKSFRKMLLLGFVDTQQILEEEPEMADQWFDYPLGVIEELLDQVETAMEEIDRASVGINPSPEAVALFSEQWYS